MATRVLARLAAAVVTGGLIVTACGGPTSPAAPEPVEDVTATPGAGVITVTWSHPGTNVTGFEILREAVQDGTLDPQQAAVIETVGADAREYVDEDIEFDTSYEYSVVAVGIGGKSEAVAAAEGTAEVSACYDQENEPIADPILAEAIRTQLSLTSGPTCADLKNLTDIEATDVGISSLSGLQHAENLLSVGLDNNQITSLEPLAGHKTLQNLWVGNNQITDISPIADLTQLTGVSLWSNPIDSIEALRNMDGLVHAYIGNLGTNDLDPSPLAGKTQLEFLHIDNVGLVDLSFLSESKNLVHLQAHKNALTDASILGSLTALQEVNIGENQVTDISFIDDLDQLLFLSVYQNPIADHSPIHAHTDLQGLDVGGTGISDISFLEDFSNLEYLSVYGNPIVETSYIESHTQLHTLDMGGIGVSDISFLANFTNLQNLWAWGNEISDVSALAGLANLSGYVNVAYNLLTDIGPLASNTAIGEGSIVQVEGNCLDLAAGSQASQDIETLRARGAEVTDCDQREVCET